ncbi:isoamyl acetate-hydrolyzing esterase 1 homolog isoform X1 [Panthera tigris]|uniref:isoamyl acetate-hydrolyzing esterase 1 homolog isoform X1 n=1 Tax=Panthera tigris TaxID=9694 RepID=UPI001C6FBF57|nr:isoamyl acetate-hydrolyzing esterase 1 homolog isoform X1 [Panthera tigris]
MRSGAGECSDSSRPRPGSDKAEFTALRQCPRENREAWYKLRRGRAPPFPRSPLQWLTARPGLAFPRGAPLFSFQQGGWGASLADKLVRKCDVLNRGFSGYNTRWAKIILPRLIKKGTGLDSPVAVTIFFGANDSALKDENPKQHVPLDEYVANLKSMVRYLKSVDVPEHRIVLISPPPLCEAAWERECLAQGCKLNRLNLVVGEYAGACLQVARDCGTDVLDLWTLMQKDGQDFSSFLSDGLHLSPEGNEFLFSHLWPLIEKKVSSLPLLLPYWRDVAEAKPELSLLGDGDH